MKNLMAAFLCAATFIFVLALNGCGGGGSTSLVETSPTGVETIDTLSSTLTKAISDPGYAGENLQHDNSYLFPANL